MLGVVLACVCFLNTGMLAGPLQAENSSDKMGVVTDEIALIKNEYEERKRQFNDELVANKLDKAKRRNVTQEWYKYTESQKDRLLRIIRSNPKDPLTFDAILLIVGPIGHPIPDDIVRLVIVQYPNHPRMGELCLALTERSSDPWAEQIIKTAAENHSIPHAKGQALFALAEYNRWRGLPLSANPQPSPEESAKSLALAEHYYSEVIEKYPAISTPDGNFRIGEKATAELARLRNLLKLSVGNIAPNIEGEDLEGLRFKLSDYRGKVVLLGFSGYWCSSCRAMLQQERLLVKNLAGKPFVLLGVNSDTDREKMMQIQKKEQITWRSFWDGLDGTRGPIDTAWNIGSWPTLFLIDNQGIIRRRWNDAPDGKELEGAINILLQENKDVKVAPNK